MSKRILTVDDSATMRNMLRFALEKGGYEVIQANDGQDGLNRLDAEGADVIITDVNMPVMDGLTMIREVRSRSIHKSTPILVLTTEASQAMKDKGRAAGATGWIVKPFDPDKLLAVVRKVSP